jgi:hypothetical protein
VLREIAIMLRMLLLVSLLLLQGCAHAWVSHGLLELNVRDVAENRRLEVHGHEGRGYIAGRPGNEYQLILHNRSDADVLAVVAVDGVNVISGETASWEQPGYIVPAHGEVVVQGWRKSLSRVAAFYFTPHANAYASRTGRPDHVGVIGVAVFRARVPDVVIGRADDEAGRPERADRSAQSAAEAGGLARSAPAPGDRSRLGTGHGSSQSSPARYAGFERASHEPQQVVALYYDSYTNLVAQGVIRLLSRRPPNPFPGAFVPDPH